MRMLDFIKEFPHLYAAGTSVHLVGSPGGGKSSVLKHEIRDLLSDIYGERFGFCGDKELAWLCPTLDAPDARGFLVPTKDANGEAASYFTKSPMMPSKAYLEQYPRGLMVLDERSAADLLLQKALAPAVLDKQFGDHILPPGWMVVSCSNRISDRAGVIRPPMHLINRECTIELETDATSWAVWAEKNGVHLMGIAFAKRFPGVAFAEAVPNTDGPYSTARSFTAAMNYLTLKAGVDNKGQARMDLPTDPRTQQVVNGHVGAGVGAQMFAFFKLHDKLPDIEDIEKDPLKAKCPDVLDAGYAAAQMCVHHAKPTNVDKLWTYVERLPRELQVSTAVSLIKRSGGVLINSKALGAWVAKNRALVTNVLE